MEFFDKNKDKKASAEPRPATAMQPVPAGALAVPTYMKTGDSRGKTRVEKEDLILPRLALAQALSPELTDGDPKFIQGLKQGDAFNTLTSQVYGRGAVEVVVVRQDPARYVEFLPRELGGGVVDFNVPPGDPRTQFSTDDKGHRIKPTATKFLEFIALLGPEREPIALSFKGAGLKAARQLLGVMNLRPVPTFATRFSLTPTQQKNDKGTFYVFSVRTLGNVDEDTYAYAEKACEAFSGRDLVTDRDNEPQHSTDEPF